MKKMMMYLALLLAVLATGKVASAEYLISLNQKGADTTSVTVGWEFTEDHDGYGDVKEFEVGILPETCKIDDYLTYTDIKPYLTPCATIPVTNEKSYRYCFMNLPKYSSVRVYMCPKYKDGRETFSLMMYTKMCYTLSELYETGIKNLQWTTDFMEGKTVFTWDTSMIREYQYGQPYNIYAKLEPIDAVYDGSAQTTRTTTAKRGLLNVKTNWGLPKRMMFKVKLYFNDICTNEDTKADRKSPVTECIVGYQNIITKASLKKKKLTLKWSKNLSAVGYDVYVSTTGLDYNDFKKVKTVKKTSATITKIKGKKLKKKAYYVYVVPKLKNIKYDRKPMVTYAYEVSKRGMKCEKVYK